MGLLDGTTQQEYYQGNDYGNYQFISLEDIINQFMLVYVGEDKIIPKAKRLDVAFHAQRAMQELSFDTFKSVKAQEIILPASLQMILPQDYVNYTKISWVDSAGIKHLLYPASKTSNPKLGNYQDSDGNYDLTPIATLTDGSNEITLDGDYKGIVMHGMKVEGPHLKSNSYIHGISNTAAGLTKLTLKNKVGGSVKNALATHSEEITISRFGVFGWNSHPDKPQTVIETTISEDAPLGTGSDFIKIADSTGIEKGMFLNYSSYSNSEGLAVKVIAVGTNNVQLSVEADYDVVIGDTIHFVSDDKDSRTWDAYKSATPSENQNQYDDDSYWPMDGSRYGLDPQHAQANGSFYIDNISGKIHFSSNISGKTVVLDYISDSLGTDGEMQVHKFAEEAMYKWISHAILAGKANIPEYQVNRFKKERFAAIRTAKLRLSNIKLEEITQVLRGKSKQIKH